MTEGRKYDDDKLRFDMIPMRPLLAVVHVFTLGAKKYGQHHLASVAWCAMALIELEETHSELDDRARA
jgi:hypothetical protein